MRPILFLLPSLALVLAACGPNSAAGRLGNEPTVLAGPTPEETIRNVLRHNLEREGIVLTYDYELYDWQNREEIMRTLEFVEVDTLGERAAVFVRWSVGPKVYRDGHMLRRVGDVWALTNDRQTYFSDYAPETWQQDPVALFDKRLEDWIRESPTRFDTRAPAQSGSFSPVVPAIPVEPVIPW